MSITKVTLAKESNTGIEYLYPKTTSDIVEYNNITVKEKLDSLDDGYNNIVNNIVNDINNIPGILEISKGGTGANTAPVALYNLTHRTTTADMNLDDLTGTECMGYYYFGSDYLPDNAPVNNARGYLLVLRGGGAMRKQIWINQGDTGASQNNIYIRSYTGTAWTSWSTISRNVALAGNDTAGNIGWHKVASGTLTGSKKTSIMFAVHDTRRYVTGILALDIKCINDNGTDIIVTDSFVNSLSSTDSRKSTLTEQKSRLTWLITNGISNNSDVSFSDFIVNTNGNTWTMYYNVKQRYYRMVFEVIEESSVNTEQASYTLFSEQTKYDGTPIATFISEAPDISSIHPKYDAHANGFYKVTVDEMGHVSNVSAVTLADITNLGVPTNHYNAYLYTGTKNTTSNTTSTTSDPYITVVDKDGTTAKVKSSVQLKGSGATTVSANSGIITISTPSMSTLTINGNGTKIGDYNGSTAKTINITPANIGAATSDHTHATLTVQLAGTTLSSTYNGSTARTYNIPLVTTSANGLMSKEDKTNINNNLPNGRLSGSTVGTASIALGTATNTASAARSYAIGRDNTVTGSDSFAFGNNNGLSNSGSLAIGYQNTGKTQNNFLIGTSNTANTNANNIGLGFSNTITGSYSVAIGKDNNVSNRETYAFGTENTASAENNSSYKLYACAIGFWNKATGYVSTAIGRSNTSSGENSYALGRQNTASGTDSCAIGYQNISSGSESFAFGKFNRPSGYKSIAIGIGVKYTSNDFTSYNTASGNFSVAIGRENNFFTKTENDVTVEDTSKVAGENSYTIGYANLTSGEDSYTIGRMNNVSGAKSIAIGVCPSVLHANIVSGEQSIAIGALNNISGTKSVAIGIGTHYNNAEDTNIVKGGYSYIIGTSNNSSKSSSYAFGTTNTLSGENSYAIGRGNTASGTNSYAIGRGNTASGTDSYAIGKGNTASGTDSYAIGKGNTASGTGSYAIGNGSTAKNGQNNIALMGGSSSAGKMEVTVHNEDDPSDTTSIYDIGGRSFAMGLFAKATAAASVAIGTKIESNSVGQFVCGFANSTDNEERRTSLLDNTTGNIFVVGNGRYWRDGESGSEGTNYSITKKDGVFTHMYNCSNAFRITTSGTAYVKEKTVQTGADYAEFVKEWYDGNINNEDRVGYMVTIKNGKLYKANEGDYIIGITSGNPSVVGNGDEDYYWMYERDRFNRVIIEESTIQEPKYDENGDPILNEEGNQVYEEKVIRTKKMSPKYDASKPYVERAKRPEWDYVGMRGIVPCRDDGTCEEGGFCKCGSDGIATKADTRGFDTYYVIERIDEETISVEVK